MILLNPFIIAILAGVVLALMLIRYAHSRDLMDFGAAIPYALLFCVYLAFGLNPDMTIQETRLWGRSSIGFLLIVNLVYASLCLWAHGRVSSGNKH